MASGPPHTPYGPEALTAALEQLHGFYRSSVVLWRCQDWGDWRSAAKVHDIEQQWVQVSWGAGSLKGIGSVYVYIIMRYPATKFEHGV